MMQPTPGVAPPPPPMAVPAMDPQQQAAAVAQPQQQWMMMQPQAAPPQGAGWPPQPQAQPQHPQPQQYPQYPQQPQQYAQQQAPPQQQQAPLSQQPHQPMSAEEIRTLWVGDLQFWMDENYLHSCFALTGEVLSVKIIRNKQTGQSEGYGFVEFVSHGGAERVLQSYNGIQMPSTEQLFRLNWASFGIGEKRPDMGPDYPIFVGDLASDVTDYLLQETFRTRYSSVRGAKVVTDRITGRPKGYGFVRFGDENEQIRAMTEMNGVFCSSRPMRIGPATTKKTTGVQPQYTAKAAQVPTPQVASDNDPNNTTIFVGGLDPSVTDEMLRQVFAQYGEVIHVKIPVGKRCGFVQFSNRACAEEALSMLHGTVLGQQAIRLSWGRSPANKQPVGWGQPQQPDPNQWNGAYYGYGQGYDASYGYAPQPQDPNMYGYGPYAYGNYQQQVN
uniref:TSA: Wollemia nobilis Ref_Wollemi_Transcript_13547_2060 transcribed RNA sequence n=1 Tax=Wollemia nobilis TaxID=56998 RepID=A0A0C9S7H3_9CONI